MKPTFIIALLYICLSLLVISCETPAPEPDYVVAEVVGADCDQGWCILKLENSGNTTKSGACYAAPPLSEYVTTRNLPAEYQVSGTQIKVALAQETNNSPRCQTINHMFPAVQVKHVSRMGS